MIMMEDEPVLEEPLMYTWCIQWFSEWCLVFFLYIIVHAKMTQQKHNIKTPYDNTDLA